MGIIVTVTELPPREPDEPHDNSGRVEMWHEFSGKWVWHATYLDWDHAKQNIATLRGNYPASRWRLSPPGTRGYAANGSRIED
jgi:hypothetical protein